MRCVSWSSAALSARSANHTHTKYAMMRTAPAIQGVVPSRACRDDSVTAGIDDAVPSEIGCCAERSTVVTSVKSSVEHVTAPSLSTTALALPHAPGPKARRTVELADDSHHRHSCSIELTHFSFGKLTRIGRRPRVSCTSEPFLDSRTNRVETTREVTRLNGASAPASSFHSTTTTCRACPSSNAPAGNETPPPSVNAGQGK
eukprot:1269489-Rhodomonas_salina.1